MNEPFNPKIDYSKLNSELEDTDELIEKLLAIRDQWIELGELLNTKDEREQKKKGTSHLLSQEVVKQIVDHHMTDTDGELEDMPASTYTCISYPERTIYDNLFE